MRENMFLSLKSFVDPIKHGTIIGGASLQKLHNVTPYDLPMMRDQDCHIGASLDVI